VTIRFRQVTCPERFPDDAACLAYLAVSREGKLSKVIWVLLLVPLLAIAPLVLATARVGPLGWLVTYLAVFAGLAVALRISLRLAPKRRDRR
jgi:hypothetical protein